jgi:hypothetical protein
MLELPNQRGFGVDPQQHVTLGFPAEGVGVFDNFCLPGSVDVSGSGNLS